MSELQRAAEPPSVDRYLAALEGETRRVADQRVGADASTRRVAAARRRGDPRRAAARAGRGRRRRPLDHHALLRWNRGLPLARFAETGAGDVWVEADLPLEAVTAERLDGFLGLLVASRRRPASRPRSRFPRPRRWPERRASRGSVGALPVEGAPLGTHTVL